MNLLKKIHTDDSLIVRKYTNIYTKFRLGTQFVIP